MSESFSASSNAQSDYTFSPDSAGIIYPYVRTKRWNNIFRFEAELNETVDRSRLEQAVKTLRRRFPLFFVKLIVSHRQYRFCLSEKDDVVCEEDRVLCAPFLTDKEADSVLRVTWFGSRIGMELFHVVADGHAAMIFFKTLLAQYYRLAGEEIPCTDGIADCGEQPSETEQQDAFLTIKSDGAKKSSRLMNWAWQFEPERPRIPLSVTEISIPQDQLKALSKKLNLTLGVLLTALYLNAFYAFQKTPSKREIRISVPVDLRKYFHSDTLRNFSLYMIVGINPGERRWLLEEIAERVRTQFAEQLDKDLFADMAVSNVTAIRSPAFRLAPLAVKRAALNFGYNFMGERYFTSALSNVGIITFPEALKKHIADMRIILGEAKISSFNTMAYTFGDTVRICTSSKVPCDEIPAAFMRILCQHGVQASLKKRVFESRRYVSVGETNEN